MLKKVVIVLVILIIASWVVGFIFWGNSKDKIKKAENELKEYQQKYALVIQKGDSIEAVVQTLQSRGNVYQNNIDSLENLVSELKKENQNQQQEVAHLFQPDDLVNKMKDVFPQWKEAPMGIARVRHPETGFMITTFQLPVQLVSNVIQDHLEVANFKRQMDVLGEENLTYKSFVALKDSIITLKEQKAEEYKKGLEYGLEKYQAVMKDYIETLKNPPKIEWPSVTALIAAGAIGVVTGALIKK